MVAVDEYQHTVDKQPVINIIQNITFTNRLISIILTLYDAFLHRIKIY